MKILWTPPSWVPQPVSCKHCGTCVELDPTDVIYKSDRRDGNAVAWKCPTCKKEHWIAEGIIPSAFMRAVRG